MTRDGYGKAYQNGFELTVRLLASRTIQRDLAKEVAQAAWAKGWERRHQLRDEKLVVTWVNTIALNLYRGLVRKEASSHRHLPQRHASVRIDLAVFDVARILKLSRSSDRALLEQSMYGATTKEIAQAQGVTETAVRIRLSRARRAARSLVEDRSVLGRVVAA